jgi:DNA-binding NarL/FixJ family response regulator
MKKLLAELDKVEIVGEAETALAALALMEKSKPEVVIVDIVLREGSGFEVLKNAKNQENSPLVIALTNDTSPPFRKKAQQEGVDFFFDKSTEFEKVVEVLQQLSV